MGNVRWLVDGLWRISSTFWIIWRMAYQYARDSYKQHVLNSEFFAFHRQVALPRLKGPVCPTIWPITCEKGKRLIYAFPEGICATWNVKRLIQDLNLTRSFPYEHSRDTTHVILFSLSLSLSIYIYIYIYTEREKEKSLFNISFHCIF